MTELKGLPDKELLRIDEVAEYFGLSDRTIKRWLADGKIVAATPAGSSIRVTRESVMSLGLDRIKKVRSKTIGIAGRRI